MPTRERPEKGGRFYRDRSTGKLGTQPAKPRPVPQPKQTEKGK